MATETECCDPSTMTISSDENENNNAQPLNISALSDENENNNAQPLNISALSGNQVRDRNSVSEQVSNVLSTQPDSNWYNENIEQAVVKKDSLFNDLLSKYIDDYEKKHQQKRGLKIAFFIVIIVLFVIVTIVTISLFAFSMLILSENLVAFVTAASTLAIEFIVAFFQLPKIIAKYLFDKKEDELFVTMITQMQNYNLHRFDKAVDSEPISQDNKNKQEECA